MDIFRGRANGAHLSDAENAHKAVLEASGLAFALYDLRHTFATRFAEATAGDVVALASILGHANLRTVMRYVHISRGSNASTEIPQTDTNERKRAQAVKPTIN